MNFIQRHQPTQSWVDEIDRFFDRGNSLVGRTSTPRESFHESDDAWILRLDLPGYAKADVTLSVTDRVLHMKAETPADRPFGGTTERQWKLGSDVDDSGISANLENGVLELKLPKRPKPEARSIEIS
jgi:HSP20 family protein